jgi:hypothetical protein
MSELYSQSFPSGVGVDGEDVVVDGRDVHHPVDDQWVSLEDVLRFAARAQTREPGAPELGDVTGIDLVQSRVALVIELLALTG